MQTKGKRVLTQIKIHYNDDSHFGAYMFQIHNFVFMMVNISVQIYSDI